MKPPTLWVYQPNGTKWYAHIDWHDGRRVRREGPFDTEAQAYVITARMNGMEPPYDMVERRNTETQENT